MVTKFGEYGGDPADYRIPIKGDKIETGILIEGENSPRWYGSIETIVYVEPDGTPKTRPKWAKVNKVPMIWRWPAKISGGNL